MKRSVSELDNTVWMTYSVKEDLAWTCDTNGSPAHTSTGVALGGSRVQARSRSSTYKLEEHSQQELVKDGRNVTDFSLLNCALQILLLN